LFEDDFENPHTTNNPGIYLNDIYMPNDRKNDIFNENFIGPRLSDNFVSINQRELIVEKV
jgi:hypothetical protein